MPVADTCFLIDLMRRKPPAIDLYTRYEEQDIALSTTAVTALELYKGAHLSAQSDVNLEKVKAILAIFDVIPFNQQVCEIFGPFSAGLKKRGSPLGDFDEVIASMALCHDGILITRDDHFTHVPGIEIIRY